MTGDAKRELRCYIVGAVASAALTAVAFWAVMAAPFPRAAMLWTVGAAGLAQIAVQLRCFLHLGWRNQQREDLQLILFSLILLGLMVGGTIWIMASLEPRMH